MTQLKFEALCDSFGFGALRDSGGVKDAARFALVFDCWRNRSNPLSGSNPSLLVTFLCLFRGQRCGALQGIFYMAEREGFEPSIGD